jgi:hypothetical protein
MGLTAEDALRAFASMINSLEIKHFLPLLTDDFHYASQSVLPEISSKAEFAEYMMAKLETLKRSGMKTTAEMGYWQAYGGGPCTVLSQRGSPVCTAVATVKEGMIARIDLCLIPAASNVTLHE